MDTAVLYTKQDFVISWEAVRGLVKCMQVKFIMGPGPVARRCHYSLVSVLDNVFERPPVLEYTGEVRLETFRTLLSIRANRVHHLGLPKLGGRGEYYSFSSFVACQNKEKVEGVTEMSHQGLLVCLQDPERGKGLEGDGTGSGEQGDALQVWEGYLQVCSSTVLCSLFPPSYSLPNIHISLNFGRSQCQSAVPCAGCPGAWSKF